MSKNKMHDDEHTIDTTLIKQLLSQQFPEWAELPLEIIYPEGTDNAMYKLGYDKVVRLPRMSASSLNISKEIDILPKLEPHLPIPVPRVVAIGKPNTDYPFPWIICSQLKGRNPGANNPIDYARAAKDLGEFVKAMQGIKVIDGPSCNRGNPLSTRDEEVRHSIQKSAPYYDTKLLTELWNFAIKAPNWEGNPAWIHADLHAGNILADKKSITAIVDFGSAGVGDPAVDLMVAWTLLTPDTREIFRTTVNPDEATWERARGWATFLGIVAYPYYVNSNPEFAAIAKRALDEVILEHQI